MSVKPVRCAILLSGGGRTLENFFSHMAAGQLNIEIVAVVSSRAKIRGIDIARDHGVPCEVFPRRKYDSISLHNEAVNQWLAAFQPEMIVLAGYLCFYMTPKDFEGPTVNIHPALLPKFGGKGYYGDKVHQAVLDAGEAQSGCTVHLVDGQYDTGRILDQQKVAVLSGDDARSLADRVFNAECELYPKVLERLAGELREK